MVGGSDRNVFLIQIDASSFAEFEMSEFEISRVDCTNRSLSQLKWVNSAKNCLGILLTSVKNSVISNW